MTSSSRDSDSIGGIPTEGTREPTTGMQTLVGRRLTCQWSEHEYDVEKVLTGGMGVVLVCRHNWDAFPGLRAQWCRFTVPRDLVALKIVRARDESPGHSMSEEIQTVTDIARTSGRIVPILGADLIEGLGFALVMPYFPMGSLRNAISNNHYDASQRFGTWLQLILGLLEVQQKFPQFVHGDIKPDNVLLDLVTSTEGDGGVLLALLSDLGLSRLTEDKSTGGTPRYLPPEAWMPGSQSTSAADIFALGVMLFELLTGKLPFPDSFDDHRPDYSKQAPWSCDAGVPEWLKDIAERCMRLEPSERPSYSQVVESAQAHLRIERGTARFNEPWTYSVSAMRELYNPPDDSVLLEVRRKYDYISAELRRDITHLVEGGLYAEAMRRISRTLYSDEASPLFAALRMSNSELFSETPSVISKDLTFIFKVPLHQSLATAADLYASAFLQNLPKRMDLTALYADLLPGLAIGEIFMRSVQRLLSGEVPPDEYLGSFGNMHLFYRTAYAVFLTVFDARQTEWIRERWRLIEAACHKFYSCATPSQKRTFDNIFTETGTSGNVIAAVERLESKLSATRPLAIWLTKRFDDVVRRLGELAFVTCHREEFILDAITHFGENQVDLLSDKPWVRELFGRLLSDATWNPGRFIKPIATDDIVLQREFEDVGHIGRMEFGNGKLWLTKGMPEYGQGDDLVELDLAKRTRRSLGALLPQRNVLCSHCDGQTLWIGTTDGLWNLNLTNEDIQMVCNLGPIYEIISSRSTGLLLGSRGVVHVLVGGRHATSIQVPIPEVHRMTETARFIYCCGDSDGGLCAIDKETLEGCTLPNVPYSGYVRDLYAAAGYVGFVGNDHQVLDADTAEHLGGFRTNGELLLSCRIHGDIVALGHVDGLRLVTKATGPMEFRIGTTSALCSDGIKLFAAAGGAIYAIEVSY